MFDDIPRPTCRSVYTVSDKHLRHGGSGYETTCNRFPLQTTRDIIIIQIRQEFDVQTEILLTE